MSLISVIVPAYNAEAFIEEALNSIICQTYTDIEILVADDASTDDTKIIIDSFNDERIKRFHNPMNIGYLKTCNKLIALTLGKFIAFQDADDVSHPERLNLQMQFLDRNPNYGLVGTNFSHISQKGRLIRDFKVLTENMYLQEELMKSNPFQKPSIMFRRSVYQKVGMYREHFLTLKNISEDYDWLLRVSEKFMIANINYEKPLYHYRLIPTAMTKSIRHIDQLFGHDIAKFLAKQRRERGFDDLDAGNLAEIEEFLSTLKMPFVDNPSLFYHRKAENLMYAKLKKEALTVAAQAILVNPFSVNNYRLFFYCLRKSIHHD
jgi:glycosyltransferase involved in cell wall biosynthesis